jgi:hypothetical protein
MLVGDEALLQQVENMMENAQPISQKAASMLKEHFVL